MAQTGDVYRLTDHERLTVTTLTDDLLEVDVVWDGTDGDSPVIPLPHRHPNQAEHFEVLEGELTAKIDGEQRTYRAGEVIDIPAGTVHAMWNAGDQAVHATWQVRPAMRTAEMWKTLTHLRRDGRTPSHEEGTRLLSTYAPEFELVL
jgi:mannose-6-phosphate isomerase-like protein (cupin superfamily)